MPELSAMEGLGFTPSTSMLAICSTHTQIDEGAIPFGEAVRKFATKIGTVLGFSSAQASGVRVARETAEVNQLLEILLSAWNKQYAGVAQLKGSKIQEIMGCRNSTALALAMVTALQEAGSLMLAILPALAKGGFNLPPNFESSLIFRVRRLEHHIMALQGNLMVLENLKEP